MINNENIPTGEDEIISIEDFAKIKIRVGKILSAEKVPDTDKLVRFTVDLGDKEPRQILSGIAAHYPDPSILVGKSVPVVANLAPRVIRGHESRGMILYAVGEGLLTTVSPAVDVPSGTAIK